jgi:ribose transport system ATP-binding protein
LAERAADQPSGPTSPRCSEAIVVAHLSKSFEATVALDDVSLTIGRGEVRAIVGENGAGKSTLVKILSGLVRPDNGEVCVGESHLGFGSPKNSHAAGIQTAFQEMTLIEGLTVTQNMLLPYEPTWLGLQVNRPASRTRVTHQLAALEIADVDPDALVAELDLPTRQKLEIAKAVTRRPNVLLLDEPTSTLPIADVQWLRRQIARLKSAGVTIVFISHRMAEVRQLCESVTVMRNGRHVGSYRLDDVSDDDVVRLMIGRSIGAIYPPRTQILEGRVGAPALKVDSLCVAEHVTDLSFALWPGEIVGVAALQGMGQRELFDTLFGVVHPDRGNVRRHDRPVTLISPVGALHAGISLVPEDRKTEGLFLHLSGKANASLPILERLATFGWIDRRAEATAADAIFAQLNVPPRALHRPASSFSGGNQQKIVLAKSLLSESEVLLLFDPTRGVDIGTKHEIYVLVRDLAAAGKAILLYSTEVSEIVNLCDRALVLYRGRLAAELSREQLTEENILIAALGTARAGEGS